MNCVSGIYVTPANNLKRESSRKEDREFNRFIGDHLFRLEEVASSLSSFSLSFPFLSFARSVLSDLHSELKWRSVVATIVIALNRPCG